MQDKGYPMARANRPLGWVALALAVASLVLALVSGGAARSAQARAGLRVEHAWVSSVPIAGHPAAGYLTIVGGDAPDTLVGASSAAASSIELHSNRTAGGMMHMTTDMSVAVPARSRVLFAERGRHLMIFGLKSGVKSIPITFRFASGRVIRVEAPVRPVGRTGPDVSPATRVI